MHEHGPRSEGVVPVTEPTASEQRPTALESAWDRGSGGYLETRYSRYAPCSRPHVLPGTIVRIVWYGSDQLATCQQINEPGTTDGEMRGKTGRRGAENELEEGVESTRGAREEDAR